MEGGIQNRGFCIIKMEAERNLTAKEFEAEFIRRTNNVKRYLLHQARKFERPSMVADTLGETVMVLSLLKMDQTDVLPKGSGLVSYWLGEARQNCETLSIYLKKSTLPERMINGIRRVITNSVELSLQRYRQIGTSVEGFGEFTPLEVTA